MNKISRLKGVPGGLNSIFTGAILISILALSAPAARADNEVWTASASAGTFSDWNTASNWSPSQVPTATGTATFYNSGDPDVSVSAETVAGSIDFESGAHTIDINRSGLFELTGPGITNNSGVLQSIQTLSGGELGFTDNASAGSDLAVENQGDTYFYSSASAGNGVYENVAAGVIFFLTPRPVGREIFTITAAAQPFSQIRRRPAAFS